MDVFSLEDEEYEHLFITQSSDNSEKNAILEDPNDFSSPCVSLVPQRANIEARYSDISDDEFDIPSSQISDKR